MTRAQRQQARRTAQRQRRARQQQLLAQRSASARKSRQRRNATAYGLKGATEFSCDPVLSNPVAVIELFRTFAPQAALELIRATTPERYRGQPGRHRAEGSWALAHILDGNPDWQNWHNRNQDPRLWELCGFTGVPTFPTLYLRFAELEHPRYVAAFEQAAHRFIRLAARCEPRALRHFHIDGTAAHSHTRLEHACPNTAYCASRTGNAVKHLQRASDEAVATERHVRSAQPEPDDPDEAPDPLDDKGQVVPARKAHKLSDEEARGLGLPHWRTSRYFRFGSNGHIYRSRDKDVGVRAYNVGKKSKRAWVGGYFLPAVCDFFWAPAAMTFFEADIQEHLGWPALHRQLLTALNDDPTTRPTPRPPSSPTAPSPTRASSATTRARESRPSPPSESSPAGAVVIAARPRRALG